MSTEADLLPRLEQACDHLVQDSAATNWGVLIDEDNVKVFHLKDSKPDRLMGQIVVSGDSTTGFVFRNGRLTRAFPVESVLHDLYDFEARRKWDTTLSEKSHVVESLSDDTSVVYMYIPGQMSVSAREMLNGRRRRALPDGAGYVVAHNKIEWASKPVTKDIVRASNTDTGYVIKKVRDTCRGRFHQLIPFFFAL